MKTHYLLYDDRCELCVRFQQEVARRDPGGRIAPVGFGDPRIGQVAPGVPRERLENSFHLVLPDGRLLSGEAAIPELLSLLRGLWPLGWLLKRVPGARRLCGPAYAWIASRRGGR